MNPFSPALADYAPAFADGGEPFLTYYGFAPDKSVRRREFTRGEFWSLARRAGHVLQARRLSTGDCFAHYFSGNRCGDLAFRLGATMVGAVPVTVNWQADTPDRIAHKIEVTECRLVVTDDGVAEDALAELSARFPGLTVFAVAQLEAEPELALDGFQKDVGSDATRIIIFTSGTTGRPKGVPLTYRNYATNRATFESFLRIRAEDSFAPLVVNPLHHTNSTAITDWALRRPGTSLHLVERYSTQYWTIFAEVAGRGYERVVAPTVSRHFDFLENLHQEARLPLPLDALQQAMRRVDFLIGSAPVGPTTVKRLQRHTGRLPVVRFGSTETCLQVMGTPHDMSQERRLAAFRKGWSHTWDGEAQCGYCIGRPHPPHTECRIVRSTKRGEAGYFADCDEGEPGYLITRGQNVMAGYVKDEESTAAVLHEGGWYSGLGDVCFWLTNGEDGRRDYYWMSRESALLIRGGANYAYAQINAELKAFVVDVYGLPEDSFDLAVVGLRTESEHEDECCVTMELRSDDAKARGPEIEDTFLSQAQAAVSKGARPNRLRFAPIPRNFKGAILVPELKKEYRRSI
jgi:acyl-CoA synthetase (AMP-forming)/AMP-acid ligase II